MDEQGQRERDADPGGPGDPAQMLREISASKMRLGCFGCAVTGTWAVATVVILVLLILYVISRL